VEASMPTVSVFYGIKIEMYFNDHEPPHLHAYYAEDEAVVRIDPVELLEGGLSHRAWRLVQEWTSHYQAALLENWA
jgi:hypothetical protein